MLYNCDDIKRLLESSEESTNMNSFLEHVAACEKCRELANLNPECERNLDNLKSISAPEQVYSNIMESVRKLDTKLFVDWSVQRAKWAVPTIAGIISVIVLYLNRPLLTKALALLYKKPEIDISWLRPNIMTPVKTTILSETTRLSGSPLLLAVVLAAAFLIWFYSISGLEKATK